MKRFLLIATIIAFALVDVTIGQELGIYFDLQGETCSREIHDGDAGEFWILARFEKEQVGPLVGAEFRLGGWPDGWSLAARVVDTRGVVLGDPDKRGSIVGLYQPTPSTNIVPLVRIYYRATSEVENARLWLETRMPPSNPSFAAPVVILEKESSGCVQVRDYTVVPVPGTGAVINGKCTTAVDDSTWDRVKKLFRE